MFYFEKMCKFKDMSFIKRVFWVLVGIVAGLNLYLKEANADVCFLPSMNGGECGMSMEDMIVGENESCPPNYVRQGNKCVFNCQGYTYNSSKANEMKANHFKCEKCPGRDLYKCSTCEDGYRKKIMANECVHVCEIKGYTFTYEQKVQMEEEKHYACQKCNDGEFYKCSCPDELEEVDGECVDNRCIQAGFELNYEEKLPYESIYYTCSKCETGDFYKCECDGSIRDGKCTRCANYLASGCTADTCHTCGECRDYDGITKYTRNLKSGYADNCSKVCSSYDFKTDVFFVPQPYGTDIRGIAHLPYDASGSYAVPASGSNLMGYQFRNGGVSGRRYLDYGEIIPQFLKGGYDGGYYCLKCSEFTAQDAGSSWSGNLLDLIGQNFWNNTDDETTGLVPSTIENGAYVYAGRHLENGNIIYEYRSTSGGLKRYKRENFIIDMGNRKLYKTDPGGISWPMYGTCLVPVPVPVTN